MNINWKLRYGLIVAAMGIVLLVMSLPKAISFLGDPIIVDSVEKASKLKKGDHVKVDITMSDGYYMSYTEDNKVVARYYIAVFFDPATGTDTGLTVRVGKDYFQDMENATKACDQFFREFGKDQNTPLPSTVYLTVDGVIEEFSQKEEKEIAKTYVDTGYLDYIYVVPNTKSASFIIIAIAGAFVLAGAVLIILFILGRKKDKQRLEEMRAANPGYYQAPTEVTFNNSSEPVSSYPAADMQADQQNDNTAEGYLQEGNGSEKTLPEENSQEE